MLQASGDYFSQPDYQQMSSDGQGGRCVSSASNTQMPDEDSSLLPRTVAQHQLHEEYSPMPAGSPYSTSSLTGRSTGSITSSHRRTHKPGKALDKDSEEYKRRRTLNNIAVKKSRAKAKAESQMTAERLNLLMADNKQLERRLEKVTKEIVTLHSLFSMCPDVPEAIRAEVARVYARLQNYR